MKSMKRGVAALLAAAAGLAALGVHADPPDLLADFSAPNRGGVRDAGPDVIVGNLYDLTWWGTQNGLSAYSVGTISCNMGDTPLQWIANNNLHPVIGQSIFRLKDGRFEHIGQSWLKHGFTALQERECGACIRHPNGTALGVLCSDPYSAGLNGSHTFNRLGPKYQVNAYSGVYPYPPAQPTITSAILSRRVQVLNDEMNPAMNAGALYYVEGHYVTKDDADFGHQHNNASYRRIQVTGSNAPFPISFVTGHSTRREKPAIFAWQEADPEVTIDTVDVPSDGRLFVASRATDIGGGNWRYNYSVQNLNSDRSASSFTVHFPPGTTVAPNPFFRDVAYHSGEIQVGDDWTPTVNAGNITWTMPANANPDAANALRWGTIYTFEFIADRGPEVHALMEMNVHKPGTPTSVQAGGVGPGCYADCDKSTTVGTLDIFDFLCFQSEYDAQTSYACNCDTSTGPNTCDIFDFLCYQNAFDAGCQ